MVLTQLNKITNIADKSSYQGTEFTSRVDKLNHGSEQAIELTNLDNENKMLKDQHNSYSKHENEMQNGKREFKEISRMANDQLSKAHEAIENQDLKITNHMSQVEVEVDLHNTIVDLKPIANSKSSKEDIRNDIKVWVFFIRNIENNICIVLIRTIITFANQNISVINSIVGYRKMISFKKHEFVKNWKSDKSRFDQIPTIPSYFLNCF